MSYFKGWTAALAVVVAAAASATDAEAARFRRGACAPRCVTGCAPAACVSAACAPVACAPAGHYETQVVERTIYVPQQVMESRTVTVTECRPEVRERTYNVCRRVPYQETRTEEYTVMVQKTEMRTVVQTVCKPVVKQVERTYTVMVPHQETRQAVRTVAHCVPVHSTRTVCVDEGRWEVRSYQVPCAPVCRPVCGGCGGCNACGPQFVTRCCRVWVPNIVHREIPCTVMKYQTVQQPYEYCVTVCRPETRSCKVNVTEMVKEQVTRQVPVTVCVPEKRTRTHQVTLYRDVTDVKTEKYTVMVPHQVQKQIQVPVCRVVPQTVQQTVCKWVCDAAPAAASAAPASAMPAKPAAPQAAPKNKIPEGLPKP